MRKNDQYPYKANIYNPDELHISIFHISTPFLTNRIVVNNRHQWSKDNMEHALILASDKQPNQYGHAPKLLVGRCEQNMIT